YQQGGIFRASSSQQRNIIFRNHHNLPLQPEPGATLDRRGFAPWGKSGIRAASQAPPEPLERSAGDRSLIGASFAFSAARAWAVSLASRNAAPATIASAAIGLP